VFLSGLEDASLDRFDHGVRIFAGGENNLKFVPQPLTGSGEIEVVALDGVAVSEGDAAAGGMAGISPVASLEKNGVEEPDLHDFAGDTVDFDPVAEANA